MIKKYNPIKTHWQFFALAGFLFIVVLVSDIFSQRDFFSTPHVAMRPETPTSTTSIISGKNPQIVLLSFDGSKSITMWEATRQFSKDMVSQGKTIKFTYFINSAYFLPKSQKNLYVSPDGHRGESAIGFASSSEDVAERIQEVNGALAEGHEIASHAMGHFNGKQWSSEKWKHEMDAFKNFLFSSPQNDSGPVNIQLSLSPGDIVGFRAPELGTNSAMNGVLSQEGYRYDASYPGGENTWPKKNRYGVWEFPIASIRLRPRNLWTIAVDYSIFRNQPRGQAIRKGTQAWNDVYAQTYSAYMDYFKSNYGGNHAPVSVVSHFAQMNDGVYWEALKKFAGEVCGQPDVYCTTYKDAVNYLDSI